MNDLKNQPTTVLLEALVASVKRAAREELIDELRNGSADPAVTSGGVTSANVAVRPRTILARVARGTAAKMGATGGNATARVLAYVKASPGARGEQIAKDLGLGRADMIRARRELGRKLKFKGQKRAMQYFPAKGA